MTCRVRNGTQAGTAVCRARGYRLTSVIAAFIAAALGAITPDAAPELLRQRRLRCPRAGRMVWSARKAVLKLEADDRSLARLRLLVAGAVRPPEDDSPEGASLTELAALAGRLGQPLLPALRTWLSVCNGAAIGPGGVFGQRPDRRFLVAGDGCGNYYVLTADGTVGFVETMSDPAKLARQAAPDLLSFMTSLLAPGQSP